MSHTHGSTRHITDTPASEREFLENLHELDHKIKFLNLQDFNDCRAVYDVRDVVDKLKLRAVAKTREFLLHKVYQFRKPMANYQMLQNQLLNYRSLHSFQYLLGMVAHCPPTLPPLPSPSSPPSSHSPYLPSSLPLPSLFPLPYLPLSPLTSYTGTSTSS